MQVCVDEATGAIADDEGKAARAETGSGKDKDGYYLSAVVGMIAASSAITGIVAGTISPPVAFGLHLILLSGLSLAMASVHNA